MNERSGSEFRRECIKGLVASLLAEGARTPKQIAALLTKDITAAATDLANTAAANTARKIGDVLGNYIKKNGLGNIMSEVRANYERGTDANANRR